MVETLLLAVSKRDEDRRAELAETAAGVLGADGRVEVLHAFDEERYEERREQLRMDRYSETSADDIARRNTVAADLADRLQKRDIEVAIRGAVGDAADAILRAVDDVDADMVVVGGRDRSQTGKFLFGSTAQDVLLGAPVPVTFVKARDDARTPVEAYTGRQRP